MRRIRVIPTLLVSRARGGLVKGTGFKKHVYVGDPINAVKVFNDKGVDEIAVLDVDATRERRGPDFAWLREICAEAFMPLAYGGGISRIEHVKEAFQGGAEKIVLNSAAVSRPELISQAAQLSGSQSVVVSIDVRRGLFGQYRAYTENGTRSAGHDPVDLAKRVEAAGAGEILLTSIDREGRMEGYDVDLISRVSKAVQIPVVASGGAGHIDHMIAAVREGGASAVAAGSMFVFIGKHRAVLISYPAEADLQRLFRAANQELNR